VNDNVSSNFPSKLGKWKIKKRLASREDKIVLLGENDGEFAAIKILKNADLLEDRERRRFDQEVINLKKLNHPHIPKIVDLDLVDAMQPWIATEFISGPTIQERVSKKGPLKLDEWLKALKEITSALAYVHSVGVYHRDISPSNIILSDSGAKLIDFGMSYLENTQTYSKSAMNIQGTPATLSPESLSFKKDSKMDMFSLGSTFIFAGSRHYPFSQEDNDETNWMQSILYHAPNFHNLNHDQIRLLQPLLYKDLADRISSSAYLDILEQIQINNDILSTKAPKLEFYLKNAEQKITRGNLVSEKLKIKRRKSSQKFLFAGFGLPLVLLTLDQLSLIKIDFITVLLFISLGLIPVCAIVLGFVSFFRGLGVKKWGKGRFVKSASLAFLGAVSPYLLILILTLGAVLPMNFQFYIQDSVFGNLNSTNTVYSEVKIPELAEEYKDNSPKTFEIESLIDSARELIDSNNYKKALSELDRAVILGSSEAHNYIGLIKDIQGFKLEAKASFLKAAKLNYPGAFWNLGYTEFELGNTEKAIDWWEEGKLRNDPSSFRSMAKLHIDGVTGLRSGEREKQFLSNLRQAASLNDANSMYELGEYFANKGSDLDEALYWAKKSSGRGLYAGHVLVGRIYEKSKEWNLAELYYQKAINRNDPEGMYHLGKLKASRGGEPVEVCKLLEQAKVRAQESINYTDPTWQMSDIFIRDKIKKALDQLCSSSIISGASKGNQPSGSAKPVPSSSPSSIKPINPNNFPTVNPKSTPTPVLSSDELKASAPVSKTVVISEIFGRVFKDNQGFWVTTLSNYKGQPVPPITGIQFRLTGFPNADWFHVPYKLKTSAITDSVYAAVDDIFLTVLLNRSEICPEFRAVREEKGEIVNIWTKGQPECVNDYKP
jgi:serine/threonine protein kinase/TPR repeat protein